MYVVYTLHWQGGLGYWMKDSEHQYETDAKLQKDHLLSLGVLARIIEKTIKQKGKNYGNGTTKTG